jgi:hypothetical protein
VKSCLRKPAIAIIAIATKLMSRREAGQSSNSDPYSLLSPEGVTFGIDLLGQTCRRTGWEIHAYCLMDNHFHLLVEMPRSNLSVGMQWLLGFYAQRFNR